MRNLSSATQHTHPYNGGTAVPHVAMHLVPRGARVRYSTRLPSDMPTIRRRVQVVATSPERPLAPVPDFDDHVRAIAGDPATMPPGPMVRIARREKRHRCQLAAEIVTNVAIAIVVLLLVWWFGGVIVRVFWPHS